ncbi:MAG: hypothetical protein R3D59_17935, partial [Paracoccaceae bacterium]
MDVFPSSTIAALCYARDPEIDFHALVTDLARAILDGRNGLRLDMPAPGLALCDMPGMRIGLSRIEMGRTFPGSLTARHYPLCILLSVGPGTMVAAEPSAARHARTHAEMVARIQDIAAADRVLMFERAGSFDPEIHDAVVDDIRGHLDKVLAPNRAPTSDEIRRAPADRPHSTDDTQEPPAASSRQTAGRPGPAEAPVAAAPSAAPGEPEDIVLRLTGRVEAELARLERARAAFEEAEAAADRRAQETHGMRVVVPRLFPGFPPSTLRLFRMPGKAGDEAAYPDYEHMPANLDERPLLHRAAVNALNVTVMTIALPVGAALLTMSVLGREDMLFSSRVTAVT